MVGNHLASLRYIRGVKKSSRGNKTRHTREGVARPHFLQVSLEWLCRIACSFKDVEQVAGWLAEACRMQLTPVQRGERPKQLRGHVVAADEAPEHAVVAGAEPGAAEAQRLARARLPEVEVERLAAAVVVERPPGLHATPSQHARCQPSPTAAAQRLRAPASSSRRTASASPPSAAELSGVRPAGVAALGSAPARSSARVTAG